MDHTENSEQFVQQLTENQNRLYGYVYSLLGDHSRTADIVQETNLVLWRKINEFDPLRPFLPWAFAIARFQVMAHMRDQNRDRLLLDAELVETLSGEVEKQAENIDQLRRALRQCMQSVTSENRELIEQKYLQSMSLADVAAATNRTVGAIKVALLRVRRQLSECVERRIATEE